MAKSKDAVEKLGNDGYRIARAKIQVIMRPVILKRDGYKCIACGSRESLEVCHVFPLAKMLGKSGYYSNWDWLNSKDNLVTLCERCHAIIDDRFAKLQDDPRVVGMTKYCNEPSNYRTWGEAVRRGLKREFDEDRDIILLKVCDYLGIKYSTLKWHQEARYG